MTKAEEIYNYMKSISQEDTTKEEFSKHLEKYSVEDILKAHDLMHKAKK